MDTSTPASFLSLTRKPLIKLPSFALEIKPERISITKRKQVRRQRISLTQPSRAAEETRRRSLFQPSSVESTTLNVLHI